MKVIFLDIDGVVVTGEDQARAENTIPSGIENENYLIHQEALNKDLICKLNKIIEATSAVVFIVSAWRRTFDAKQIEEMLKAKGFQGQVAGNVFLRFSADAREAGALHILTEKHPEITHAVVLDDSSWFYPSLDDPRFRGLKHIKPMFWVGLTDSHVEEAISILNNHPLAEPLKEEEEEEYD